MGDEVVGPQHLRYDAEIIFKVEFQPARSRDVQVWHDTTEQQEKRGVWEQFVERKRESIIQWDMSPREVFWRFYSVWMTHWSQCFSLGLDHISELYLLLWQHRTGWKTGGWGVELRVNVVVAWNWWSGIFAWFVIFWLFGILINNASLSNSWSLDDGALVLVGRFRQGQVHQVQYKTTK